LPSSFTNLQGIPFAFGPHEVPARGAPGLEQRVEPGIGLGAT
jgi:hypothetical protein